MLGTERNRRGREKLHSSRGYVSDLLPETILLVVVTSFFIYLLLSVGDMRPEAARLPRFTAIVGLILVLAYVLQKICHAARGKHDVSGQILDMGFDAEGLSKRVVMSRSLRLMSWFCGMLIAIWLVGYHIAVPVFVIFYLFVFGRTKWWQAAIGGGVFFLLIYGLFDLVMHMIWPDPALWSWLS